MSIWKFLSVRSISKYVNYSQTHIRYCCAGKSKPDAIQTKSESPDEVKGEGKKGVVLGVYQGDKEFKLTAAAEEVNQKSGGKLCKALNDAGGHLVLGRACILTDVIPDTVVAVTSLGPKDAGYNKAEELEEDKENVRVGVGAAIRRLQGEGCSAFEVEPCGAPTAAAEAAHLAAWNFEEFKSPGGKSPPTSISAYGGGGEEWELGSVLASSQNWARYLADMPANHMTPVDLAQAALDMLCPLGVHVEARDLDWIKVHNMQAFLAVARGSCEAPVLLECRWSGAGTAAPLLLAAKGVTFDSGGLCLKSRTSMIENRGSMAGAAAALGALRAAAIMKLPINICCVIPICENMVSGQCMKVGDVVTALNGLSIEIENTDMEGRLMLADALVYGQHAHKPSLVIDIATFTQGVALATGGGCFGCFSNSAAAWRLLRGAGARCGDRAWRLPLWHYYHAQLTDQPAVDLRNQGSGHATPCLGAAFLKNFVCGPWLHLDITGVGKLAGEGGAAPAYLRARRMSGRPTRTLAALLQALADTGKHGDIQCDAN